jgi:hypothetical protein
VCRKNNSWKLKAYLNEVKGWSKDDRAQNMIQILMQNGPLKCGHYVIIKTIGEGS